MVHGVFRYTQTPAVCSSSAGCAINLLTRHDPEVLTAKVQATLGARGALGMTQGLNFYALWLCGLIHVDSPNVYMIASCYSLWLYSIIHVIPGWCCVCQLCGGMVC